MAGTKIPQHQLNTRIALRLFVAFENLFKANAGTRCAPDTLANNTDAPTQAGNSRSSYSLGHAWPGHVQAECVKYTWQVFVSI